MRASRGMGCINPSKMPKGKTKHRKDGDTFTQYSKGGKVGEPWTKSRGANADYTSKDDYIKTRRYSDGELTPEERYKYAAQTGAERISTNATKADREVTAERMRKAKGKK